MDPTVIRERRRALHLTQQDLADLSGVSVRFIRDVEHGKASIQLDSLLAILRALGLQLNISVRSIPRTVGEAS